MVLAFLDPAIPAVAPGQKQAEDALSNIAGQGILGSLCVLLIVALFFAIDAKAVSSSSGDLTSVGSTVRPMFLAPR